MMLRNCCLLLLVSSCLGQRQLTSGERQIRLEDIERDNLAASQKTSSSQASQQPQQSPVQQQGVGQQQLAAYQQQLLLQQLQQQYFAPTPLTYNNFGGVPLMIIPSNQLGVGGPPVPVQAYFVPADASYIPPYQPQVYQPYQVPSQRYQQPQREFTVPRLQPVSQDLTYNSARLQPVSQDLTYNSVQVQPSVQTYRQPQNYPSASIVYAGTPSVSSFQQLQTYQQPSQQQLYNAYNALYQQRQEKNSFGAGVKSTPAPPLKPQNPVYSAQQTSNPTAYSNYKNFNYNQ